ncbi:MAG: sulfatase-like hydrolase/transferase [Bacillus subtilis]|nr:sulfatase-like hydrolase/transferase [Bacillus subtilis]
MYPTGFTVSYFEHATDGIETIPTLFREVGYHTMAVHGSPIAFYNRVGVHPLLGFDASYGTEQIDPDRMHQVNGWTDDATVFAYAVQQMKHQETIDEPYFMQLLSTVSHLPYFVHPEYTRINDWGIPQLDDGIASARLFQNPRPRSRTVVFGFGIRRSS